MPIESDSGREFPGRLKNGGRLDNGGRRGRGGGSGSLHASPPATGRPAGRKGICKRQGWMFAQMNRRIDDQGLRPRRGVAPLASLAGGIFSALHGRSPSQAGFLRGRKRRAVRGRGCIVMPSHQDEHSREARHRALFCRLCEPGPALQGRTREIRCMLPRGNGAPPRLAAAGRVQPVLPPSPGNVTSRWQAEPSASGRAAMSGAAGNVRARRNPPCSIGKRTESKWHEGVGNRTERRKAWPGAKPGTTPCLRGTGGRHVKCRPCPWKQATGKDRPDASAKRSKRTGSRRRQICRRTWASGTCRRDVQDRAPGGGRRRRQHRSPVDDKTMPDVAGGNPGPKGGNAAEGFMRAFETARERGKKAHRQRAQKARAEPS